MAQKRTSRIKSFQRLADYQESRWGIGDRKDRACLGYPGKNPHCVKFLKTPPGQRICYSCREYRHAHPQSTHEPRRMRYYPPSLAEIRELQL